RQHVVDDAAGEPGVLEGDEDALQRRAVEVGAAGAGEPPEREQHGRQAEDQPGALDQGHAGTSPRIAGCQASTRRSTARVNRFAATPSSPVTTTRAYISGTASLACAMAISLPRPGYPMTS